MVSKKRERIDIIYDMLVAIQRKGGEIKPTHLMYKANLAHRQLKSYLEELLEKNFVEKEKRGDKEVILITDNGLNFIEKIQEMRRFEDMFKL